MQSLIGLGGSYRSQATAGTRTLSRLKEDREQLGEALRDQYDAQTKQNRDSMVTTGAGLGMKAAGTKAGAAAIGKGMAALGLGGGTEIGRASCRERV